MSSSLTEDNIQQQIEAKKRRLEELKQKRLQRQQKTDDTPSTAPPSSSTAPSLPSTSASPLPSPRPTSTSLPSSHSVNSLSSINPSPSSSSDDLLDVVNSLITNSPSPAPPLPTTASPPTPSPSLPKPSLTAQAQSSLSIPPVEKVQYDVGTQTSESFLVEVANAEERKGDSSTADPHSPTKRKKKGGGGGGWDEEDEEELRKERDLLRHRETELMTTIKAMKSEMEKRRVEEEALRQPSTLTAAGTEELTRTPEFVQFFVRSSLMMERALAEKERRGAYDYAVDYADEELNADHTSQVDTLVYRLTFDDASKATQRPVSALDWSPKYPELMLAAYATTEDDDAFTSTMGTGTAASAQGCVLLWNLHLTSRPEYHFTSDSSILSAFFHPTQPRVIIGGSASGQLLMWDTRSKSTPINRTSLSNSHSYPVYVARPYNSQTVSVSSDGQVCYWQEENWNVPSSTFHLRAGEMSVSAMDFHQGVMYVGSDDGSVYKCRMHGEGEHIIETIKAHDAPITSLSFQPTTATASSPSASSLYLTSSYDWTVKLFAHHTHSPLHSFESSRDYAYDAQWHPTHPGIFVTGDSTGKMDLWKLGGKGGQGVGGEGGGVGEGGEGVTGKGWEVPQYSVVVGDAAVQGKGGADVTGGEGVSGVEGGRVSAVSKLKWHGDGSVLSVGSSHGQVSVWELNKEVMESTREERDRLWDVVTKQIAGTR